MLDETTLFDVKTISNALVRTTLDEVYQALKEKGYNPISQIVGYLKSGDPGYITSYKGAREKIQSLDTTLIFEAIVKEYLEG